MTPEPSGTLWAGVRLAATTFTVLPLPAGRIDRAVAGVAMALAPVAGIALGLVTGAAGIALVAAGGTGALGAAIVVGLGVLLTRGLHVDGLADTADGLGSYRDAAGALEIMRRPDVGPFGVAAIVLILLVQVAGAATALGRPWPASLATVVAAVAAGRLAVGVLCRRGVPAARPDGLGALVAGTVAWPALGAAAMLVASIGAFAVPGRPWLGPIAVAVSATLAGILGRHAVRRLGGITGDVLGAGIEVGSAAAFLILALGD